MSKKKKEVEEVIEAIGISKARGTLSEMVDRISSEGTTFVIHYRGKPKAVVMSVDEYAELEGLKATLEELEDPGAYELFKQGERDIREGRTKSAEEILGEALI